MENRSLLYTVSSRYAVSFAAYFIAIFTVMNYVLKTGYAAGAPLGMLLLIPVLCYFYTKLYRNRYTGGYITFLHSWVFNVMLFVFAGLLFAFYQYIYTRYIDPGHISWVLEILQQNVQALIDALPKESQSAELKTWSRQLEELPVPTPIEMAVSTLGSMFYGGFFVALIVALFTKKKPLTPLHREMEAESRD